MHRYTLSIGGNAPLSRDAIEGAIRHLGSVYRLTACSSIYTTPAINGLSPDYLNAVALIEADIDAEPLNAILKTLERQAGRRPGDKAAGIIILDIDIVIADDAILRPADYARSYFQIGYQEIKECPRVR